MKRQTFNEINITPLTDIFLVLLIIMIVIAPSFQSVDNNIQIEYIDENMYFRIKESRLFDGILNRKQSDFSFLTLILIL